MSDVPRPTALDPWLERCRCYRAERWLAAFEGATAALGVSRNRLIVDGGRRAPYAFEGAASRRYHSRPSARVSVNESV